MSTTQRCAIYVRSAAPAAAEAIDAQIRACRTVAGVYGLAVEDGDIYVDNGRSRLNPAPSALTRLLDAARAGEISTVVTPDCTHLDRVDPRVRDYLEVLLESPEGKVPGEGVLRDRVLFATGAERLSSGESIPRAVGGMRDTREQQTITHRTSRGRIMQRLRRAHTGFYNGNPPYGFELVPDDPSLGGYQRVARRGEWRLVPDEVTLRSVRLIFDRAEAGRSLMQIAADLAATGAASPGSHWTRQAVRRILSNPLYAGRLRVGSAVHPEFTNTIEGFLSSPPIEPDRFDRMQERLRH